MITKNAIRSLRNMIMKYVCAVYGSKSKSDLRTNNRELIIMPSPLLIFHIKLQEYFLLCSHRMNGGKIFWIAVIVIHKMFSSYAQSFVKPHSNSRFKNANKIIS